MAVLNVTNVFSPDEETNYFIMETTLENGVTKYLKIDNDFAYQLYQVHSSIFTVRASYRIHNLKLCGEVK